MKIFIDIFSEFDEPKFHIEASTVDDAIAGLGSFERSGLHKELEEEKRLLDEDTIQGWCESIPLTPEDNA
jgi:hypothetical protein